MVVAAGIDAVDSAVGTAVGNDTKDNLVLVFGIDKRDGVSMCCSSNIRQLHWESSCSDCC